LPAGPHRVTQLKVVKPPTQLVSLTPPISRRSWARADVPAKIIATAVTAV